jgi:hypothetical protein
MKRFLVFFLMLYSVVSTSQIISTFAGCGTLCTGIGDGGPASVAQINYPVGGIFDRFGNYYFCLGSIGAAVQKISPTGIMTTFAGSLGSSGSYMGNGGPATAAQFNNPQAVAVDTAGNVYIADAYNNLVCKVDIATGIINTIAGNGIGGYNGDGIAATAAEIWDPLSLCIDKSGNLYIGEYGNSRVRKVNASGIISTVAGNGICGNGVNGSIATASEMCVWGLCIDNSGNLYIGDSHAIVYKVNTSGILTYYAGNGIDGFSGDGGPATAAETEPYLITMDKYENLFINEYEANRVRMVNNRGYISTIVGNGIAAYGGDGGSPASASVDHPAGIAVDSCDNLYISDSRNWRIRKITYSHCDYLEVPGTIHREYISPNPTFSHLNIENIKEATEYKLFNLIGSVMQQGSLIEGNNMITIQSLPSGMYLLEIIDEQKNRTVHKIIKQ